VVAQTFGACLRYRVTGLAAEAAFFAILSLPPLVFGLAGAVGFVAQRFEVTTLASSGIRCWPSHPASSSPPRSRR
jgi:membrane protein